MCDKFNVSTMQKCQWFFKEIQYTAFIITTTTNNNNNNNNNYYYYHYYYYYSNNNNTASTTTTNNTNTTTTTTTTTNNNNNNVTLHLLQQENQDFSLLNHFFLSLYFSSHCACSETNWEDFIPYVCLWVCFTATRSRQYCAIFPYDYTVTLLVWINMENKWYFTWKPKNDYSIWQFLSLITERDTDTSVHKVWVEAEGTVDRRIF